MDKNICAPVPPMGWNSWDCYSTAITEQELIKNIDYMAENLKEYGWQYIVCDIQWYEPLANSNHYRKFADLCMDEYGRVIPAPNRFPSSAEGEGFKKIAAYIHDKGLKFGIHIMRGIPRQAVHENTPVKGTSSTARDIAHPSSICCWNSDNYGIDATKPGAQEYYDSIIELYVSWGVDFIKVDDICVKYGRPDDEGTLDYGGDEIELIRNAIDKCGRPIVLSLSPGPAMLNKADHLCRNANMWRITNDFWDSWDDIMEMFSRCRDWSPYVSEGCYPDCDMLPLGHLSIKGAARGLRERQTRLTKEEQRTMMTLWTIFRSPLMLGCELTDMDEWTRSLISNREVLGLLANSRNAREIFRTYDLIVWRAEDYQGNKYAALFNIANWTETFTVSLKQLGAEDKHHVHDMWEQCEFGEAKEMITVTLNAHDAKLFRLS